MAELTTARLRLRPWRDADLAAFAALNADPEVCRHLLGPLSRAQSDALAARCQAQLEARGFGVWAVEASGVAPFIGMVGLAEPAWQAAFTPCVEVLWRLSPAYWGHGYATEAARAALGFGFERLGLPEIVALTVPENVRSRAVMARLGMAHAAADDFDHPLVPPGHRLSRHVLYRLPREAWQPA